MKIGILVISLWTLVILGLLVSPLPNLTPSPYTTGFYHWDNFTGYREATFCDLLADVAGLSAAITLSTASYLMWVQRTRRPS